MSARTTIKILFLAANPRDTTRLQIDEEMRAIDQAMRMTEYRERFDLRSHWAVRYGDLQELLMRHQPHIVHFSGHGKGGASIRRPEPVLSNPPTLTRHFTWVPVDDENEYGKNSQIVLQDESGRSTLVPAEALTNLFRVLKHNIRCVVLNACYSEVQAQAIAEQIDCVIGMSDAIGDMAAIHFSVAFYGALGYGCSIKEAFDLGCNAINLANLPHKDIPQLWSVPNNPAQVVFVPSGQLFTVDEKEQQPSPTPEQFAELVTRLLGPLQETRQGRNMMIGARATLDNTRRQLRLLAEYKEAHDLIQRLESSYRVVHALLYDDDIMLPLEQVRWPGLKMSCEVLQESIYKLCQSIASFSFATDVIEWQKTLEQASRDLHQAYRTYDASKFDAALSDIYWVVSTQTSRMNDRLIATVDVLRLRELANLLQRLCAELVRDNQNTISKEHIAALTADVATFTQLSFRLSLLRTAHDRWQQMDNELRQEQATITRNLYRFQTRWQRRLGQELRSLSAANRDSTQEVSASIDGLDAALAQEDKLAFLVAFEECRRAVMLHFLRIDYELRTLCNILKEAGGPLDTLLEKLT